MKLSVILPFTNEGSMLQESINSILQQSFSEFELLLIDNAEDEQSLSVARATVQTDSRCRLLRVQERGIAFALNRGVAESKGELIARMDADDIAHPERFRLQVRHLQDYPESEVVSCRTSIFPTDGTNEGFRQFVEWQNGILSPEEHSANRFIESPLAHPSVMMRKRLFSDYGFYDTGSLPEDYELWLRWMANGVRFVKIPEVLLQWRDLPSRLSRSHTNYEESAFFKVKAYWLKRWMDANIESGRPVMVCGGSRNIRAKVAILEEAGILISAFTDVVDRPSAEKRFIPASRLTDHRDHFIINLISKRDVRESIRGFLCDQGFTESRDFIMCG